MLVPKERKSNKKQRSGSKSKVNTFSTIDVYTKNEAGEK